MPDSLPAAKTSFHFTSPWPSAVVHPSRDSSVFSSGWGVDAQKMVGRLNDTMKTKVTVPQGGVVWVFAVKD